MKLYSCRRCGRRKFYTVRRSRKRCKTCGYEFTPWLVEGVRLKRKDWKNIIEWFFLLWIACFPIIFRVI